MKLHAFLHRLLTRRYPLLAFLLTFLCPGWGQIYNRDWKWLWICAAAVVTFSVFSTIYLFDTFPLLAWAIGIGLFLDIAFGVQAFLKARRQPLIERPAGQISWGHLLFRLVVVYGAYMALLFAIPDGYGYIMPTRLRSFQIPSESMVPNLLVGDRLVADGWAYWGKEPERGDIVVFQYPRDHSIHFVKRLIGLPGDVVEFKQGELWLNGRPLPQRRVEAFPLEAENRHATEFLETLDGRSMVFRIQPEALTDFGPVTVPEGHYFMVGDNRDRSSDSRVWGFASREEIVGRMVFIYFSWNGDLHKPRMERMGMQVR